MKQADANKRIIEIQEECPPSGIGLRLLKTLPKALEILGELLRQSLVEVQYPQDDLFVGFPLVKVVCEPLQVRGVDVLSSGLLEFKVLFVTSLQQVIVVVEPSL